MALWDLFETGYLCKQPQDIKLVTAVVARSCCWCRKQNYKTQIRSCCKLTFDMSKKHKLMKHLTAFAWRVLKKFKLVCQWTQCPWKTEFSNLEVTHVKVESSNCKRKKAFGKHDEKNPKNESVQKTKKVPWIYLKGFWRSSRVSINEHSALEKLNFATQNLPMSRAAIAKEKKPLEKHDEKNPKNESVQKTKKVPWIYLKGFW
jgi:hypothetical protein